MDNKEKKIVIFGDVNDSMPLLRYLEQNADTDHKICDLFEKDGNMKGYDVFSISDIGSIDYDCAIITVRSDPASVKKILIEEYGVDAKKILEFWKVYNGFVPLMVCDRFMLNPKHKPYNGIICGLSHSEVGILPDKLGGENDSFCNLSVSSQDLFFQYKTIEYCLNKYPGMFSKLEYAIIETHDYNYFNFDTSLAHASFEYLCWGGFNEDPHHFDNNYRYEFTFEQAMQHIINNKYGGITQEEIRLWDTYCKDVFEYNNFDGFNGNFDVVKRTAIVTDKQIDGFLYNRSVVTKMFPETIKENISNIQKIFDLLISVNPDIKIYSIIIPRYCETEKRDHQCLKEHITYFQDIIRTLKKKYDFTHLDFKDHDISLHRNFYYDAAHLNLFGAAEFTKILNDIIFA